MDARRHLTRGTALLVALALLAGTARAGTFRRPGEARPSPADTLAQAPTEAARGPAPAGLFLRSLAVPGWGQAVLARSRPELKGRGRAGLWLDLGLAAGVWGLTRLGQIKESEYQAYARRAAGAGQHADGSEYWIDVSNYLSRADYNQAMLESGWPERRYLDAGDDWRWPDYAALIRYRDLRAVAERARAQTLALGGAVFINHLLSGVQALKLGRQELALSAQPVGGGLGLALSLELGAPGRR
jgi:hypothetical protein